MLINTDNNLKKPKLFTLTVNLKYNSFLSLIYII